MVPQREVKQVLFEFLLLWWIIFFHFCFRFLSHSKNEIECAVSAQKSEQYFICFEHNQHETTSLRYAE